MFVKMSFRSLIKKYGQAFDWAETNSDSFLAELVSELYEGHSLHGKPCKVVARRFSQDDILCQLSDMTYAIVHLTYSKNNMNSWPMFISFQDLQSALKHIENEYVAELLVE